jgi:putative transposase
MSHPWKSNGEKRTVTWTYTPPDEATAYLKDMQQAVIYALQAAYSLTIRNPERNIPSPIDLRREIKEWFNSNYSYAKHHINPVCRAAAMLRSYRKNHHGQLRIPDAQRLAMRIDAELFKIVDNKIRLTLQPGYYTWLPINTANKHYQEYARGRPSELLITDRKVCLTFIIGNENKPLGKRFVGSDLNFSTIDTTTVTTHSPPALEEVNTDTIRNITRIQNDFSRRRRQIQLHVRNPQKREKKLRETRGRQRNRITDALQKLSTETVRENPDASHVFENLKNIRKGAKNKGKKFRTSLNRWPYRMYQSMVD